LKVLNIFNWLAGEYKEETLERLWKTRLIDILYNILKGPTSSTLTEISINLVANMLSDETCKNIMDHPMLNKIISFLKHQNYVNGNLSLEHTNLSIFLCVDSPLPSRTSRGELPHQKI
jgi:hypothetical protein